MPAHFSQAVGASGHRLCLSGGHERGDGQNAGKAIVITGVGVVHGTDPLLSDEKGGSG